MNKFFLRITLILFCLSILGCKSVKISNYKNLKVTFLSDYILPEDIFVNSTEVGGLSGIDFCNETYYLVCDDSNNPRIYEASITIENNKISNVSVDKVILINSSSDFLDLESIRFDEHSKEILLTSEGHIFKKKDPLFFSINESGDIKDRFQIPESFKANSLQKPRHNGTLEGLCTAFNKKGYWLGMELPLEADGPEPQLENTKSPVRITYINAKTKMPEKQFSYFLDPVAKKPLSNFSVNGLTDLLEYDENIFLVLERSYSSGLGNQGNTIKLFKVDASKATNTLKMDSLASTDFNPAKKELLVNFEGLRDKLTDNSIDNIEGITFGPKLPNGHKSLILISDNNFNRQEKQLNQFILLEITEE
ncbi:MAG: esterase-like activity of phytase family protein [Flavobacteriaceae bacterium]|nr:esterase-like activity of phytase family protein [Flavobacteriaceae bacterium]